MDASPAEAAEERLQFLQEAAVFVRAGEHKNLLRFYGRCEPDKRSAATRDLRFVVQRGHVVAAVLNRCCTQRRRL